MPESGDKKSEFNPSQEKRIQEMFNFCLSESAEIQARLEDVKDSGFPPAMYWELVKRLQTYIKNNQKKES